MTRRLKEIRIRTAKNDRKRATYFSPRGGRWFPMPLAEAEVLISNGEAKQVF